MNFSVIPDAAQRKSGIQRGHRKRDDAQPGPRVKARGDDGTLRQLSAEETASPQFLGQLA